MQGIGRRRKRSRWRSHKEIITSSIGSVNGTQRNCIFIQFIFPPSHSNTSSSPRTSSTVALVPTEFSSHSFRCCSDEQKLISGHTWSKSTTNVRKTLAVSQTSVNRWHVLTVPSNTPILECTPLHIKILVAVAVAVNIGDHSSMVLGRVTVWEGV